jgi:hypothetical protein
LSDFPGSMQANFLDPELPTTTNEVDILVKENNERLHKASFELARLRRLRFAQGVEQATEEEMALDKSMQEYDKQRERLNTQLTNIKAGTKVVSRLEATGRSRQLLADEDHVMSVLLLHARLALSTGLCRVVFGLQIPCNRDVRHQCDRATAPMPSRVLGQAPPSPLHTWSSVLRCLLLMQIGQSRRTSSTASTTRSSDRGANAPARFTKCSALMAHIRGSLWQRAGRSPPLCCNGSARKTGWTWSCMNSRPCVLTR